MQRFHLFLVLFAIVSMAGCTKKEQPNMQIDHIILAINDLDSGIYQFEQLTGIKASYGGEHPNSFTQNAIVPLNDMIYIEILAPKSGLDTIPQFFRNIDKLTPIGFAISTNDITALEQVVMASQFETKGIENWSRQKPNGDQLEWKLLRIDNPPISINPFFISWSQDTDHPSVGKGVSCTLKDFKFKTPHRDELDQILNKSKSNIPLMEITKHDSTQLIFTLKTPRGTILFE